MNSWLVMVKPALVAAPIETLAPFPGLAERSATTDCAIAGMSKGPLITIFDLSSR